VYHTSRKERRLSRRNKGRNDIKEGAKECMCVCVHTRRATWRRKDGRMSRKEGRNGRERGKEGRKALVLIGLLLIGLRSQNPLTRNKNTAALIYATTQLSYSHLGQGVKGRKGGVVA
jgi:hypothetical protein